MIASAYARARHEPWVRSYESGLTRTGQRQPCGHEVVAESLLGSKRARANLRRNVRRHRCWTLPDGV